MIGVGIDVDVIGVLVDVVVDCMFVDYYVVMILCVG